MALKGRMQITSDYDCGELILNESISEGRINVNRRAAAKLTIEEYRLALKLINL